MNRKYTLILVLTLFALPVMVHAAPGKHAKKASKAKTPVVATAKQQQLNDTVQAAVLRAQAAKAQEVLDPQILTQAEARLQKDRDAHSGRTQHDLGYYYRQIQQEQQVRSSASQEYDPQLLTQAESRLQKDRDAHSGRASHTLDYYYQQVLKESEK